MIWQAAQSSARERTMQNSSPSGSAITTQPGAGTRLPALVADHRRPCRVGDERGHGCFDLSGLTMASASSVSRAPVS